MTILTEYFKNRMGMYLIIENTPLRFFISNDLFLCEIF